MKYIELKYRIETFQLLLTCNFSIEMSYQNSDWWDVSSVGVKPVVWFLLLIFFLLKDCSNKWAKTMYTWCCIILACLFKMYCLYSILMYCTACSRSRIAICMWLCNGRSEKQSGHSGGHQSMNVVENRCWNISHWTRNVSLMVDKTSLMEWLSGNHYCLYKTC